MKKILSIIFATILMFSISTIAFAAEIESDNKSQNADTYVLVPYGSNYPTSLSDLPYYSVKSRFTSYNYTAKRVSPNDFGIIWSSLCFDYEGSGSVTVTVALYRYNSSTSATFIDSYSFSTAYTLYNTNEWTGLDTSRTYFLRVSKTGSSTALMKVGLGSTKSSASDYSF